MPHNCGTKFCRKRKVKLSCGSISYYCMCANCGLTTGYRDTEQEAILLWLDGDVCYNYVDGYETLVNEKGWAE